MNLYYRFSALVLVLNLVIAVAVGISTSIFTATSPSLSVVLALVSLTLGMVLDIRLAAERQWNDLEQKLTGERDLVRFILDHPAITVMAWDILHSLERILETPDRFLSNFAKAELKRATDILKDMTAGPKSFRVRAPVVQETWAYLFDAAAKGEEIVAVSAVTAADWWAGDAGSTYIEKQKSIVDSGVPIRRIMVLSGETNNDATPEENRAMRKQTEAGINVRYCGQQVGEPEDKFDLVVVGDRWSARLFIVEGLIEHTDFSAEQDDLDRRRRSFDRLWCVSDKYSPLNEDHGA